MLSECLQCEELSKYLHLSSLELRNKIHQVTSVLSCFPKLVYRVKSQTTDSFFYLPDTKTVYSIYFYTAAFF